MQMKRLLPTILLASLFAGCATQGPEMETVDYVDLDRFMGEWYVIANIPTFVEKGAHNAVEIYELDDNGTVATTFRFRKDGFDGKTKEYNPRGFVRDDGTNALWGMRFIWPFKGDYRIVYLEDDYSTTIIGRQKRDFVWIMARQPELDPDEYQSLVEFVASIGYDTSKLVKVPQSWPAEQAAEQ